MPIISSTNKNKKKVICHVPTSNQFENIKPIEVKCFLDNNEIEKQQTDVTATIMTIVPQSKQLINIPSKKPNDMIISKPIRHLAILPSENNHLTKELIKQPTNLDETFTMYNGPTTTPNVGRSLDNTLTIDCKVPINNEVKIDDTDQCDNTIVSTVCELIDQPKLQQKPHSLIGRYQLPNSDSSLKPNPSLHIATVYYNETPPLEETTNKQILIQQFYNQLEKMKATFNNEQSHQLTTNTLTFDNGQVKQISSTNPLKEKTTTTTTTTTTRVSSATISQNNQKKSSIPPKKQRTIKNPSTRIQSAPIIMATRSNIDKNSISISSCKQRRNEKLFIQQKKPSFNIKDKKIKRTESAPPNHIDIRGPEVTLLPNDEQECQQIYEKLQRLQPNGVCVDINTLRRALYPPVGTPTYPSKNNHDQSLTFKSYRQRTEEMPQSWVKVDDKYISQYAVKQQNKTEIVHSNESNILIPSDDTNIDRIVDQVKKHAEINYCYYTRTK